MNTQLLKSKPCVPVLLGFLLCAATELHAQQGFGGFGGFGGGGNANRSSTSSSQQYNANGAVGNATISIDPDTHNITIIADEDTTRYIAEVVTNLDRPQPQVLIKVVFMEVTHNDSLDIGIEGAFGKQVGSTNNPLNAIAANAFGASSLGTVFSPTNANAFGQPIGNFAPVPPGAGLYQILGTDFQATLRAIATAGKAELLSRPSVLARNNQPATIVVGQSVPLISAVNFTTFGNQINSVTYRDVGIILKVTPYITSDGLVQMIVQPSTSSIDPTLTIPISVGVNAPVIDTRSADTVVMTPDGQTVVIGGLMQKSKSSSESKIPFLGDIPWLGNLFKRKTKSGSKTELLIFLTPHVIQAPSQLAALSDKEPVRRSAPRRRCRATAGCAGCADHRPPGPRPAHRAADAGRTCTGKTGGGVPVTRWQQLISDRSQKLATSPPACGSSAASAASASSMTMKPSSGEIDGDADEGQRVAQHRVGPALADAHGRQAHARQLGAQPRELLLEASRHQARAVGGRTRREDGERVPRTARRRRRVCAACP